MRDVTRRTLFRGGAATLASVAAGGSISLGEGLTPPPTEIPPAARVAAAMAVLEAAIREAYPGVKVATIEPTAGDGGFNCAIMAFTPKAAS